MRKVLSVFLAGVLVVAFYSLALAEEKKESMMDQQSVMGQQGMMGKDKMMKMNNMRGMMGRSLVATSDGGVIVMVGNKLLKYDKNLDLKKEVEIKMDVEGMRKMMKQMKGKCPKNEAGIEGGMMENQ